MLKYITLLAATFAVPALTGCQSTADKMWVRTDGQPMSSSVALQQQYDIDAEVCKGEAQKANLSAGTNYYGGIVAAVAEDMRRTDAILGVARGCMAQRGYMMVDAARAHEMARASAENRKEREKTTPPVR